MEVFVEEDVIAPVRIALEGFDIPENRPPASIRFMRWPRVIAEADRAVLVGHAADRDLLS